MTQKNGPCEQGSGVVSGCGNSAEFLVWISSPSIPEGGMRIPKCQPCADQMMNRFAYDETRTVHRDPIGNGEGESMSEENALQIRVNVTEDDLLLAVAGIHNRGHFILVGNNGEQIVLVHVSQCDECGNGIPDGPGGGSIVNKHHALTCSLHGVGE